jgi:hypothetical protein
VITLLNAQVTCQIQKYAELANESLRPLIGTQSFNMPSLPVGEVRQLNVIRLGIWHCRKKGIIDASKPKALTKLGLDKNQWTTRVKGIGSGYWRVIPQSGKYR